MDRYPPESFTRWRLGGTCIVDAQRASGSQTFWCSPRVDYSAPATAAQVHSTVGAMAHPPTGPILTPTWPSDDSELWSAFLTNGHDVSAAANTAKPSSSQAERYSQSVPSIFQPDRMGLLYEPLPKLPERTPPGYSQGHSHDMGPTILRGAIPPSGYPPQTLEHFGVPAPPPPSSLPPFPNHSPQFPTSPSTAPVPSHSIMPALSSAPTALGQERKLRSRIMKLKGWRPPTPEPERDDEGNWYIRCPIANCGLVQHNKRVCDMRRHLDRHFSTMHLCGIPVTKLDEEEFAKLQVRRCRVRYCEKLDLDYVGGCGKVFPSKKTLEAHFEVCYER
ncbi:hypothetical protein C8Q73DRAFT_701048 [Cubamyces lactineus]|nr:hypothetical protein C8Q73DRAFT_701048 [Cubamyces lactineus]